MIEMEITCVNKPDRASPHERITHLGNFARGWKMTSAKVMELMMAKSHKFYTVERGTGKKVYLFIAKGEEVTGPYPRCRIDNKWSDNLLSLPECNEMCLLKG